MNLIIIKIIIKLIILIKSLSIIKIKVTKTSEVSIKCIKLLKPLIMTSIIIKTTKISIN